MHVRIVCGTLPGIQWAIYFPGNARSVEPDDVSNATTLDWPESGAPRVRSSQQYASNWWLPKRNGKHSRCVRCFWHAKLSYGWHVQPASGSGTNESTGTNVIHSWSKFLPTRDGQCCSFTAAATAYPASWSNTAVISRNCTMLMGRSKFSPLPQCKTSNRCKTSNLIQASL